MKISIGGNRVAFIFPAIGIVIKLPVIHFIGAARNFFADLRGKNAKLRDELFRYTVKIPPWGIKSLLFKGIADNWREFCFYRKTKHPFVQPTYFSLLGFLNIQKFSQPCQLENVDLWDQLYEITDGDVSRDIHHFENPKNFCLRDGKLVMLDYGSPRTHGVIIRHGTKILELYNPAYTYSWDEAKKRKKRNAP